MLTEHRVLIAALLGDKSARYRWQYSLADGITGQYKTRNGEAATVVLRRVV